MRSAIGMIGVGLAMVIGGCGLFPTDQTAQLSPPDGIDPHNPNTERATSSVEFDGIDTIRVDIPFGHVVITQVEGGDAAVLKTTEVVNRGGQSKEQLLELLNATNVTAGRSFVDDSRLDVKAVLAAGLKEEEVSFEVRLSIPKGANVEVFVGEGPVEVSGLSGNIEIDTTKGAITAEQIDGNLIARTTESEIKLTDVSGDVSAETTEADLNLRLSPAAKGRISVSTTNAKVVLAVPKDTGSALSLVAIDGLVSVNLTGFSVSDIHSANGLFEGVLNGGGGAIEVRAELGSIEFSGF